MQALSSSDGSFRIQPVRQWGLFPLIVPMYPRKWETVVTVSAPGFTVHTSSHPANVYGPSVMELGEIRLARP